MKRQINMLYKRCANLNLYFSLCEVKEDRVIKELTEIELIVIRLLKEINNERIT